MSNLVIVAVPDENDHVWKVSSEKVPHLTLLFLGEDAQNLASIVQFVEHAASTMLRRFYLPVDRRGVLGEDEADVVFFKKNRYDSKAIREFRNALLQESNIRKAYDAAPQFDGPWQPHLTLGYPATPANEEEMPLYDVAFNKIAVWTGDFDGPDFLLKDYWDEVDDALEDVPMDVSMSDIQHVGVKGMRWGQRKTEEQQVATRVKREARKDNRRTEAANYVRVGETKQDFKDARKDAKWLKRGVNPNNLFAQSPQDRKVFKDANKAMKPEIKVLKNKPEYQTKDAKKQIKAQSGEIHDRYDREHMQLFIKHMKAAAEKHKTVSPSGKWQDDLKISKNGGWTIGIKRTGEAKHAAMDDMDVVLHIRPIRDEDGYIIDFEFMEGAMAQTADLGADFLSHYGKKGMRWGVRNEDVASGARSVGRAAVSTGGAVGKAVGATSRFVKDVNFESRVESGKAREAVVEAAHVPFKKQDLPAVKARHGDYGKIKNRAQKPFSKEARAYRKDAKETYIKRLETTANETKNASGTRQYTIRERGIDQPAQGGALPRSKYFWDVSSRNVEHANGGADFTRLEVLMDDGFITGLKKVDAEDAMAQTVELGADFLSHYGKKGMRWGVRTRGVRELSLGRNRPAPQPVTPTATSKVPGGARRKTKIKAEGGENHPAHDDAIAVARAQIVLKKSGPAALSNRELQEVANRMNLERNVTQLVKDSTRVGKGQRFVRDLTGINKQFNETVNTGYQTTRLVKQVKPSR